MKPSLLLATLAALSLPAPGFADELASGTVRIASRLFLAPDLPERYAGAIDFLPLTEMDWLSRIVRDDPVLDGAILHIERPMMPPAQGLGPQGAVSRMSNAGGVPEQFRAKGLLSTTLPGRNVHSMFLYRPEVPEPDFEVACYIDQTYSEELFNLCSLRATYPLDPALLLTTRYYFPPEPLDVLQHRFGAIVDRMREIALCLDVTEAIPTDPQASLDALPGRDCPLGRM